MQNFSLSIDHSWLSLKRLLLVVPLYFFCASCYGVNLTGVVVKVTDGDTVTVLDVHKEQHKIRLAGIDAPESKQAYGEVSRKHLASLIAGQTVTVEWSKLDKYGRKVGKILYNGQDANIEQIKAGLAWHYKKYEGEQSLIDREAYAAAEREARAKRLGLWSEPNPFPPWEWRLK